MDNMQQPKSVYEDPFASGNLATTAGIAAGVGSLALKPVRGAVGGAIGGLYKGMGSPGAELGNYLMGGTNKLVGTPIAKAVKSSKEAVQQGAAQHVAANQLRSGITLPEDRFATVLNEFSTSYLAPKHQKLLGRGVDKKALEKARGVWGNIAGALHDDIRLNPDSLNTGSLKPNIEAAYNTMAKKMSPEEAMLTRRGLYHYQNQKGVREIDLQGLTRLVRRIMSSSKTPQAA